MATLLVYIEVQEGRASEESLGALTFARRIATEHGATLYGFVACESLGEYGDALYDEIARHGADKLVVATGEPFRGRPRPDPHGAALADLCRRYGALVVLLAGAAATFGPWLAERIGAAFVERHAADPLPERVPVVLRLLDPPPPALVSSDEAEVLPFQSARPAVDPPA